MTTAAIELASATSAIAALANVDADFGGGLVVSGVFDMGFAADQGGLVERNAYSLMVLASAISTIAHGDSVAIDGNNYVVGGLQQESRFITRLILTDT